MSLRTGRPRAIVFDWDNTLVDTWPTIHEALVHCQKTMGVPLWTLDEAKLRVRLSLREAFPPLFGDRWEEARRIYLEHFEAIHLDRMRALPGCDTMLRQLADSGLYLSVVSNKTGELLRREADHLGWSPMFGRIIGAGDAAQDKPAPDPVLMALEPSGIAPGEDVWFVGDTDADMECAIASGCMPVLLHTSATGAEFIRVPPRLWFADAARFFDHVRGL
jgi:phosphoglycolate phosphatase